MYNMKIKMKFVRLKAMGLPMYKISAELGVHRTTLTMWHQELAPYILIAKQDAIDEMLFENGSTKLLRINYLCDQLTCLYSALDLKILEGNQNEESVNKILDRIYKITKILNAESSNEKSIERFMKGTHRKMNIRTMQPAGESSGEDKDPFLDETPIWITDINKFEEHQPEGEEKGNYRKNLDNAKMIWDDDDLDINTNLKETEDINEKDPAEREIYEKIMYRRDRANNNAEKPVKNSSNTENCEQQLKEQFEEEFEEQFNKEVPEDEFSKEEATE